MQTTGATQEPACLIDGTFQIGPSPGAKPLIHISGQRRIKSILHATVKCVPSGEVIVVSLPRIEALVSVALRSWRGGALVTLTASHFCRADTSRGGVRSCAAKELSLWSLEPDSLDPEAVSPLR